MTNEEEDRERALHLALLDLNREAKTVVTESQPQILGGAS